MDDTKEKIVWVSQGGEQYGTYLFRSMLTVMRLNCETLEDAMENRISGALTASGTMEVCRRNRIPVAVTCGMGGTSKIKRRKIMFRSSGTG